MGSYNLNPLGNKEQKLANNICPICQTSGIKPVIDGGGGDSFDYICNECRPGLIISISGSALASEYLEGLDNNQYARKELQADIRQFNGNNYPLYEDSLSYFLQIEKAFNYRQYTYSDWLSGLLGSNINFFNTIPREELAKISTKQNEIFSENVEKTYNELLADLNSRSARSIRKQELLKYEISEVKLVLQGEINMEDGIVDLGNWKLPLNEIIKIKKYYREAVNGNLDLSTIVGPNQIIRIGSSRVETQYKVKAIAFEKYLKYLESIIKNGSPDKPKSQERLDYLRILYDECEGNSSSICNLIEIGKKLNWDVKKSRDISNTLMDFGYVEILTKDGHIKLTSSGISKIEEMLSSDADVDTDKFSIDELKNINSKIDLILEAVEKLDTGHEVIFEEIESLRTDAQKLSKKDFKSMALGRLINLGIDGLLDQNSISEFLKNLIGNDFNKYLK